MLKRNKTKVIGTPSELEEIYKRYSYLVFRRCRDLLGCESEASDAQQEVFLTLLERPEAFQGRSSLGTYLYSTATYVCLGRIRKRAVRDGDWHRRLEEFMAFRGRGAAVDEEFEKRQIWLAVFREVDEESRAIALYYYRDGLTQKEIASLTQLSRLTVNQKLKRFIHTARKQMAENENFPSRRLVFRVGFSS